MLFIFGCFLDLCFCFQKVDCDVLVWISQSLSWWCLPVFLDLEVYVLCLIWEVLSHYFSKYFSSPTLFLLSFWDSVDMNVRYFIIVPHRSGGSDSAQFLFFFFFFFHFAFNFPLLFRLGYFYCFTSCLILSSVFSILLLSPSTEFLEVCFQFSNFYLVLLCVLYFFVETSISCWGFSFLTFVSSVLQLLPEEILWWLL